VDDTANHDDAIRAVVKRLSRPHASGGVVIERAAIVAEGADSMEIITWILAHAGKPEAVAVATTTGGLHGARKSGAAATAGGPPRRYVLPVGALA
jgi:hypothetical protein